MSLPTTTVLGTLALGSVGALVAASAALTAPSPSPRSNEQPVVVTSPSAVPCPAGTVERDDECVTIVLAPVPAAAARETSDPTDDATDEPTDDPTAEASETSDSSHEDEQGEDAEHEDAEDAEDEADDSADDDGDDSADEAESDSDDSDSDD